MNKMKKHIASVVIASFLGIIVIIMPILTYTQFLESNGETFIGAESNEQRDSFGSIEGKTLDEAAQILGKMDTDSTPFPVKLSQVILLAGISFIAALLTTLAMKRKSYSLSKPKQ
jgi:hypothetical protein